MSFFVTSAGMGDGANLGGLAGADRHCQTLAQAAGAGNMTWHAYLSTQATGNQPAVNARDRIGQGPWVNAEGAPVAENVAHLHGDAGFGFPMSKAVAITEKGDLVKGPNDTPNQTEWRHDMLTGSQRDGRAYTDAMDHTCSNWTSNAAGSAQVGHHDRDERDEGKRPSWNSSHASRGCSQENLLSTGGSGLFYCFAID